MSDVFAGGNRLGWDHTPPQVQKGIEAIAGAPVVEAHSQHGGFSPGLAARLVLAGGGRVFAKAIGPERNPTSPYLHRREQKITSALPSVTPAPRLIGSYDDGDWVALVFEDIEGCMPRHPWRRRELERVLVAIGELAERLTPAPVEAPQLSKESMFSRWHEVEGRSVTDVAGTVPLAANHLDELVELESAWAQAASGNTLLHCDVRSDNILLTRDRVMFVDWPHARIGAAYCDLVFMLPSVAIEGPDPQSIVKRHPVTRDVDPETINIILAGIAGYFVVTSLEPPPPGLPTVRRFQREQGQATIKWLARRLAWT